MKCLVRSVVFIIFRVISLVLTFITAALRAKPTTSLFCFTSQLIARYALIMYVVIKSSAVRVR